MTMAPDCWNVEPRDGGIVLVRVHSTDKLGNPLPDAVFTFRHGDPQYEYWAQQARQQSPARDAGQAGHQGPLFYP